MKYKLFFLAALLGLSLACGGTGNNTADANSSKSNPGNQSQSLSTLCSNLHTVLPEDWEHTQSFSIDTDGDDVEECAVFYRFDIPAEEQSSLPSIGGVVYRPDDRRPPCIVPFHLYTCSRHYLCECKCKLNTQNVISEIPGDELVVEDHCGGEITAVSIFRWNPDLEPDGKYKPLGHFYGDRIKIAKDTVTLNRLLPGRAQFAMQSLYHPNGPEDSYYENVSDCYRVSAAKTRFIFYQGEPEEVTLSPYPEKVVLAFYNHYTNASEASKYLTEELWENTNKCAAGQCGCPQERTEIDKVRVTHLQLESEEQRQEPCHQCEDRGPDIATVTGDILCEDKNPDVSQPKISLVWTLVLEGKHWKLKAIEEKAE